MNKQNQNTILSYQPLPYSTLPSLSLDVSLQNPFCSTVLKTFATPYCRSSSYASKSRLSGQQHHNQTRASLTTNFSVALTKHRTHSAILFGLLLQTLDMLLEIID